MINNECGNYAIQNITRDDLKKIADEILAKENIKEELKRLASASCDCELNEEGEILNEK